VQDRIRAQHRELLQFCKDFKFERMGAFAYSEEDGTPAASFPQQVLLKMSHTALAAAWELLGAIGLVVVLPWWTCIP